MVKTKCYVGLHEWKFFREITVHGRYSAELGGYMFNPSTKKIYVCPHCGKRKDEIYDFKGDREL